MSPSFKRNQIVIASSLAKPKVGRVVIVNHDRLEKIKRMAKVEGSKIYLEGDNKDGSSDSRQFGWLDKNKLIATVIWPKN